MANMRQRTKRMLNGLTAMAVACVVLSGVMESSAVEAKAEATVGKITVSGEGKVTVTPDVAHVTIGVQTQNADAKEAQAENNRDMTKLIEAVIAEGIAEKDIQTTGYSIYPSYGKDSEGKITGYTAYNNVTVTIKDLNKIGAVLETALANGGNVAGGIQFGILDSSKHYEEALTLAIENAKIKGTTIAKAIGKTIGIPVEINETGGNYVPYQRVEAAYMAGGMVMDAGYSSIQTGELNVTANIQVVYEYK